MRLQLFCATVGLHILFANGCTLVDAGFGRACESDDDCRGAADDDDLLCLKKRCVTAEFIEVVEGEGEGDEGEGEPPAAGETCDDAVVLALGVRTAGTTGDALNDHVAICGGGDAADRAYRIDVTTTTNLVVTLEADGWDGILFVSDESTCGSTLTGGCIDDDHTAGGTERLVLPGVGPGRFFIVVDGADQLLLGNSGSFHITVAEDADCDAGFTEVKGRCLGVLKEVEQAVDRTNAAATLLDDGRVLVTGGRSDNDLHTTNSAEIFDPADDTFAPTGGMTIDRARHCSERLEDGRVVVFGGVRGSDGDYDPTDSVEVFDPDTNLFTVGPDLPRARDLFTCTQLGGGRGIYVAGGRDGTTTLDDAWLLDADAVAFTPQPDLLEPRFGHLAFLYDSGADVIVVGGRTGTDARALFTVEAYRTGGGANDALSETSDARAAACGAVLDQRHVVVFGGYEGSFAGGDEIVAQLSAEIYDDGGERWSDTAGDLSVPSLFSTANHLGGFGVVVVGGGGDAPGGAVTLYDDGDDVFIPLPPLHHARLAHVAVTLDDGRVLVVGGDGGDESTTVPLSAAELLGVVE